MMDADDEMLSRSFQYNHYYMEWERKAFVYRCWYCHEEGCDRMILWDRLSYIYTESTDNTTITNKQRRYIVFQSMMSWTAVLMGSRPL